MLGAGHLRDFISKSIGVTKNPQDKVSDIFTEKMYDSIHVFYLKKFSIVAMTTDLLQRMGGRNNLYVKVK